MKPDFALYDDYVARGLLSKAQNGPLVLYNYTERTQWEGLWDEITLHARGLIFHRESGEVVARAFDKFFNFGEPNAPEPPTPIPEVTTIKLDGSLGILYRLDHKIRWATRGSFTSLQAGAAQKIWDARWGDTSVPEHMTLLTEIIGPSCRNIVRYDTDELVLLGVRNRHTGRDFSYAEVVEVGRDLGMRVTESVPGELAALRERADRMNHQEEGFVSRWGDLRLKVKSLDYLRLSRLIQGLTDRRVGDIWYHRAEHELQAIPEEFKVDAESLMRELEAEVAQGAIELAALAESVAGLDRKSAVEKVGREHTLFSPLMTLLSGREPDLRRVVYTRRFGSLPRGLYSAAR